MGSYVVIASGAYVVVASGAFVYVGESPPPPLDGPRFTIPLITPLLTPVGA